MAEAYQWRYDWYTFQDKEVGEIYSWNGNLDDTPYDVFCLKEPDYVMKIMSNYG